MLSQKHKQGWRNPWVIGLIAIIITAMLVDGRMIWNALHVRVRMLDENFSVKDRKPVPSKSEQQAEHEIAGWQTSLHSPQQLANDSQADASAVRFILMDSPTQFQLDLIDRDNKPVQGVQVAVKAQWPSDASLDFSGTLQETTPGHYEGTMHFPRPGNWDLLIQGKLNQANYETEQRVFVIATH